jgi:DNA-binding MarR family transcriptional regulator
MDKRKAAREIVDLFIRVVNRYNALEKIPVKHGTRHDLYHSERHLIDLIGDHPGMNVTEFAQAAGVTKGAISQAVTKLEKKAVVRRTRRKGNEKEVIIELTPSGRSVYRMHREINEASARPLLEELNKHPDDKIRFLLNMFRWFDGYLEYSKKEMEAHARSGH